MAKPREELQSKLEELLGSRHVYYQPPESLKMEYPAIVYSFGSKHRMRADNGIYSVWDRYTITVIDRKPDNDVVNKLLEEQYCSYDRSYQSDNLYHDVLTIYW